MHAKDLSPCVRKALITNWQLVLWNCEAVKGVKIAKISKGILVHNQELQGNRFMWNEASGRSKTHCEDTEAGEVSSWEDQKDKCIWPPSSPDLNPQEFSIWSILAREVGEKTLKNLDSLKRKLKATWADLDEKTMRAVCTQDSHQLEAVGKANGGHFE